MKEINKNFTREYRTLVAICIVSALIIATTAYSYYNAKTNAQVETVEQIWKKAAGFSHDSESNTSESKLTKAEILENYSYFVSKLPEAVLTEIQSKAKTKSAQKQLIVKFYEENVTRVHIKVHTYTSMPQEITDAAIDRTVERLSKEYPSYKEEIAKHYGSQKGKPRMMDIDFSKGCLYFKTQNIAVFE